MRWTHPIVVISAVAGLAIRVVMLARYIVLGDPVLWEFGIIASNLVNTGTYAFFTENVPTAFMPPGFPLLLASIYYLFGDGATGHFILATLVLGFLSAIPVAVGWLAHRLWDAKAGILGFVLACFWPQLLAMGGRLGPVPIYSLLLIWALGAATNRTWQTQTRAVVVGLILGIYSIFRFDGFLAAAPIGYAALAGVVGWRNRLALTAMIALAVCVPLVPWLVRNYDLYGEFVLGTSSGYNLLRGHHENASGTARDSGPPSVVTSVTQKFEGTKIPGEEERLALGHHTPSDELENDRFYRHAAWSYIKDNPGKTLQVTLAKLLYFVVADFTHPIARRWYFWLPSFIALAVGAWWWLFGETERGAGTTALWMMFGLQLGLAMAFFVLPRYRMTVDFVPLLFFSRWLSASVWPRLTTAAASSRHGSSA